MKKLFVVPFAIQVKPLQEILGDEWKVMTTGEPVLGFRFSSAVFSADWAREGSRSLDWYDHVKSRVDGPVVEL